MAEQLFALTETEKVLWELAADIKKRYKAGLKENGHIAGNQLYGSVEQEVQVDGHTYMVKLWLEDYWQYVEWDTRGRQTGLPGRKDPPFDAIYTWVKLKKIIPRDKKKCPTQKSLAWAIKRHIGEYGTEGTHDLEKARDFVLEKWMDRLREAIGQDAIVYVRRLLQEVRM